MSLIMMTFYAVVYIRDYSTGYHPLFAKFEERDDKNALKSVVVINDNSKNLY